eukprot:TRINITY_DN26639_c0_g2_i2.p1 TRINITY_DN26639_c0_g2~~TRINITY_DN26639_c0_g2_i2.p1  ORF type:complete len:524 (+),score=63.74 TRINITY_DN26639_c0_g2_i2:105-1676(+)
MPLHDVFRSDAAFESSGSTPTLVLTLVMVGASSLQGCLQEWPGSENCGVHDVADAVFKSEYEDSLRARPSAADVARGVPANVRGQVVSWLATVCDVLSLDDLFLHGTALTLDRFAAAVAIPCPESLLCRYTLAALSTEIKLTANKDDFPNEYFTRLLDHVSHGQEPISEIMKAEYEMLRTLEFKIGHPNTLCFLRGMAIRISRPPVSPSGEIWLGTSRMLIELALYDVGLQYNHHPVVIASAALSAALFAGAGPSGSNASFDELRTQRARVLEDMSSYCVDAGLSSQFAACERQLLTLWRDCLRGTSPWTQCYSKLSIRYARPRAAPSCGLGGAAAVVAGSGAPTLSPERALALLDFLEQHANVSVASGKRSSSLHGQPCGVSSSDADSSCRPFRPLLDSVLVSLAAMHPTSEPAKKKSRRGLRFTLSDGSQPRFLDSSWRDCLSLRSVEVGVFQSSHLSWQSSSPMPLSGPVQGPQGSRGLKRGLRQALSDGADPVMKDYAGPGFFLDGEEQAAESRCQLLK